jgi:hypothetical protein
MNTYSASRSKEKLSTTEKAKRFVVTALTLGVIGSLIAAVSYNDKDKDAKINQEVVSIMSGKTIEDSTPNIDLLQIKGEVTIKAGSNIRFSNNIKEGSDSNLAFVAEDDIIVKNPAYAFNPNLEHDDGWILFFRQTKEGKLEPLWTSGANLVEMPSDFHKFTGKVEPEMVAQTS